VAEQSECGAGTDCKPGFLRCTKEWTSPAREQDGVMTSLPEPFQEQKHLVLATSHLQSRIDVHDSHYLGRPGLIRRAFENFTKL
jgi:hypothetical protein